MFIPCLDFGHGGKDKGAVHNGHVEKDLNLEVGKRLDASFCGTTIVPVTTRQGDYDPSWGARYKAAKEGNATFVCSIHFNANLDPNVSGGEAYYCPDNWLTREAGEVFLSALPIELRRSKLFAATDEPGPGDDWLQPPRTVIGAFRELPVLLCECGYLSNEGDADIIRMPWALDAIVSALRCAIIRAAHLQEIRA